MNFFSSPKEVLWGMLLAMCISLAACSPQPPKPKGQGADANSPLQPGQAAQAPSEPGAFQSNIEKTPKMYNIKFTPPSDAKIPSGPFGETIKFGRDVFVDTQTYAKGYVGNGLNCVNCHLDAGKLANAAPMWAAYVLYPQYRKKNKKVNTLLDRIRDCFYFSMNGTMPPFDSKELVGLVSYMFWMSQGAPTGVKLAGQGYPKLPKPSPGPDKARGAKLFQDNCAICHGAQGQGTQVGDRYAFPPLWGPKSYNGGAGMANPKNAAAFIKANMPLGQGGTLSARDAWDIAAFVDSHDRPLDPRKKGVKINPAF